MSDGTWNWHSIVIAIGAPLLVAGYTRALSFSRDLAALKQQVSDNEKRLDRLEGRMDAE
jgi:hypothetical protein